MIISCPECATKFSIADAILGTKGRKVRCFKCGHTWHQMPEAAPFAQPPVSVEPMGPMDAMELPPRRPAPPPLMPPTATVGAGDLPLESDPVGMPDIAPPPPMGSRSLPMEAGLDVPAAKADDDFDIPTIAPPDDPSALAGTRSADDASANTMDVDSLLGARAEDIPKVLANRIETTEKKGIWGKLIFLVVLLGGIGAALWFARVQIVQRFPGAAPLYKSLGVPIEVLGDGLEFRGVTSEMVKEGKLSVLLVRGVIANVVKEDRPVPLLRLVLLDTGGSTIQEAYAKPRKDSLEGGAQVGFQIRMEDPSAAAVRYEVTFAEAPAAKSAMQEEKPAAKPEAPAPAKP
ncbi:DUF3426 domain-containing protein [Oleispirillum naphthae]|uniref:DUF3426 domain-containing protein n=1 Tax=Oleispirillum naphthae TaxID=2838853 RepID=UPI00308230D3